MGRRHKKKPRNRAVFSIYWLDGSGDRVGTRACSGGGKLFHLFDGIAHIGAQFHRHLVRQLAHGLARMLIDGLDDDGAKLLVIRHMLLDKIMQCLARGSHTLPRVGNA